MPACRVCEGDTSSLVADQVYEAPDTKVWRCDACGVVFLDPIMTAASESAFYEGEFPTYMESRNQPGGRTPEGHFAAFSGEGRRRLRLLLPHLEPTLDVLEIGSATGYLLDAVRPHVRSVTGVEPGESFRRYARERAIETVASIDELERQYDAILMYYLFEHIREPVAFLQNVERLLAPAGRLFIEVPNVDDVLVSTYDIPAFGPFYWQKAHYFNYSHATLTDVLRRAGFDCKTYPEQRYDLSNHIIWMTEGRPGGKGRFAFLQDSDLEHSYAECLKRAWLCDTVFAVASRTAGR